MSQRPSELLRWASSKRDSKCFLTIRAQFSQAWVHTKPSKICSLAFQLLTHPPVCTGSSVLTSRRGSLAQSLPGVCPQLCFFLSHFLPLKNTTTAARSQGSLPSLPALLPLCHHLLWIYRAVERCWSVEAAQTCSLHPS